MAYRNDIMGAAFGPALPGARRADYWNAPVWGYGSRNWYGVPGYAGPHYWGAGGGYGPPGTMYRQGAARGGGASAGEGYGGPEMRSFAGVGPTHYVRSVERIRDDIYDRLTAHPGVDARDIHVEVDEGIVTLTGAINSRAAKRTAGEIAETTYGVTDVRNQLTLQSAGQPEAEARRSTSRRTRA